MRHIWLPVASKFLPDFEDRDMQATRKALTKLLVERTTPNPERDVFLWDTKVPGFGVRVYPTGKRMYVFQYRTKARQQRRVAIGLHGPFTIEKAREAAGDLYEAVRKGRDPADEQKTAARRAPDRMETIPPTMREEVPIPPQWPEKLAA
jgi:hypothetical protein